MLANFDIMAMQKLKILNIICLQHSARFRSNEGKRRTKRGSIIEHVNAVSDLKLKQK